MAGIPWTEKEDDVLRSLAESGCKVGEISLVLKSRSVDALTKRASVKGFSMAGAKPEIDMDAYAKLIKGGVKCL